VAVKLYPSGQIAHPAMRAMLDLIAAHDLRASDVTRVHVRTHRALPQNLKFHAPRSGLEAQLSMEHCLAVLLVRRRAGLADYTDDAVADPAIRDVIARIHYTTYDDEEARREGYAFLTSFIDVDTRDGRRLSARADSAKGNKGETLDAHIVDKFRTCLEHVNWPRDRTERALDLLLRLETLTDIRDLTVLLRA
jgi:2-methylcitrate dehydratase PrpD